MRFVTKSTASPAGAGLIIVTGALLAGYIATSCRAPQPVISYGLLYFIEVDNQADDGVAIEIHMGSGHDFMDIPTGQQRSHSWIKLALASGERRTLEMQAGPGASDSRADSGAVMAFREMHFYEERETVPYRSYVYDGLIHCRGVDQACWELDDGTLIYHERSDGVEEQLFVESPDRPFYLERDKEDGDLARIVITFVPSADEGSGNGVEPVEARR